MEKLQKAYEAVEMLESLNLPISQEQLIAIAKLEREYLREEVIPLLEQKMIPLIMNLRNSFNLEVYYNKAEGISINIIDKVKETNSLFPSEFAKTSRKKQYIIRVVFPDNHVVCEKHVWETLMEVIRFAGPKMVKGLGIRIMGLNLVSDVLHENEKYRVAQKEVEPGLYVCTFSSTDTKYEQIRFINRQLNLGLRIEKVML